MNITVIEVNTDAWEESMNILVSVCCMAYNHEKYISQALDSFLMQKTSFDFEVLVGEDCSTDATRQIVLDYQSRYPEIIKMISSESNVGAQRNSKRIREKAVGKYISLCEGDDYWTHPDKLQKQVDYLEANLDCSMCVHAAEIVDVNGQSTNQWLRPHIGDTIYTIEDMIKTHFSLLFATNSIVYRKEILASPPEWYHQSPVGDYPLSIVCANQGFVGYIDQVMSAYRRGVSGSWNDVYEKNKEKRMESLINFDQLFDNIDDYTHGQYTATIAKVRATNAFRLLFNLDAPEELKQLPYAQIFSHLTFKDKCRVMLKLNFPRVYRGIVSVAHFINNSGKLRENTKQDG